MPHLLKGGKYYAALTTLYATLGSHHLPFQTVPAKEPRFDAVPLKSALKKPMSVQEKHITRSMTQTTPADATCASTMTSIREYARFQNQNDTTTR